MLRELLRRHARVGRLADELRPGAGDPRLRARGADGALPGPREGPRRRRAASRSARPSRLPEFVAAGLFLEQYLDNLDDQGATDYADLIRRAVDRGDGPPRRAARGSSGTCSSTSTRTPTPARSPCSARSPATAATSSWWATRTSRSTAFRGAEVRGILDFPADFPRRRRRARADVVRAADHAPVRAAAAGRDPAGGRPASGCPARSTPRPARRSSHPRPRPTTPGDGLGSRCAPSTPSAPRPSTSPTCSAAPTSRTASRGTEMAVLVRSGRASIPPLRRALGAAGVPVEVASDEVPLVRDPAVLPLLDALRAVVNLDNDDDESADYVDHSRAEALLLGPLGGLDAGDVRRLARLLRAREKDAAHADARLPLTSASWSGWRCSRDGYLDEIAGPEADGRARPAHAGPGDGRRPGRGRHRRGRPLGAVVRHRLAGPAAAVGRARRRSGPARAPRPRLGRAPCSTSAAAGREARAAASGVRRDFLRDPGRPADPGRHAGRAGRARRRRPPAHRPPVQGPRVGPRRRRPRAAGGLARPAPPRPRCSRPTASAPTAWRARRPPRASCCRRSAGSSTSPARAPVSGWSSPPSPPPRTTASSRPGSSPSSASPSRRSRAGPTGRCRSRAWSASCGAPSPTPARRRAAARRGRAPARPPGRRDGRRPGRWSRRPTRRPGGAPAPPPGRCGRSVTPSSRCRCRPRMLEAVMVCPTQWFLDPRGRRGRQRPPVGQPRRARARARPAGRRRRGTRPTSTC